MPDFEMNVFVKSQISTNTQSRVSADGKWKCAMFCKAEQRAVWLQVTGDWLCLGFAILCASMWVDSWGLLHLCCFTGTAPPAYERNELRTAPVCWEQPRINSETMRLQRSSGLAAKLIIIACICAFHTTTAMDIPLEGEFLSSNKTRS